MKLFGIGKSPMGVGGGIGTLVRKIVALNSSSSPGPSISVVTTDASTTPTTSLFTIPAWANGYRVWTGNTAETEASFEIYRVHNGGAAVDVRSYRNQGRVFAANPGDSIALGTSDGRSLYVSPSLYPASLTVDTTASGTANADASGPPIWNPTTPHVQLARYGQFISLSATDSTERVVFISESDGNTWTPPRWMWLPASGSVSVYCTFKQIAIANYAGVAVTVAGPAGTVVGGTSHAMSLTFNPVTGTSRVCNSISDVNAAIAAAVSGDEIVLNAGTYTLTGSITQTNFTANQSAGNKGQEGITIRGATGNQADVVIATGANPYSIAITNGTAGGSATKTAGWKDLTIDGTNNTLTAGGSVCVFTDGPWAFQNLKFTSGATGVAGQFQIHGDANGPINADVLNCTSINAGQDCFSGSGGSFNSTSKVRLINCTGTTPGLGGANNQCATSHNGLQINIYGGTYSNANTNVFANDAATTPGYAFFAIVGPGANKAGVANWSGEFACDYSAVGTENNNINTTNGYYLFNKSHFGQIRVSTVLSNVICNHNRINGASIAGGYGLFNSVGAGPDFIGNICESIQYGHRNTNSVSGNTSVKCWSNTFSNSLTLQNDATVPVNSKNNIYTTSTGTQLTVGGATTTGDYNVYLNQSGYTAGAHDTAGSNAAIGSNYIPTGSGNADRNGDATDITWAGDSDPYGCVLIHKAGTPSRGAREAWGIYAGAHLLPDIFGY